MNKLINILNQTEGRRLEFKESLPLKSDLSKTVIAFDNDAGGEIYLGIKDKPRDVVGLNEDELFQTEEKVASLIHDFCSPFILPEISFLQYEGNTSCELRFSKGIHLRII